MNLTGIQTVGGAFHFGGPVQQVLVDNVADGTTFDMGGGAADTMQFFATGDVGSGGKGVTFAFPGTFSAEVDAWDAGTIHVGAIDQLATRDGDLAASILTDSGFARIEVRGGDLASPLIQTGLAAARGDGSGGAIDVAETSGIGGSIVAHRIAVDGDLGLMSASGGRIFTELAAGRVDRIAATSSTHNTAPERTADIGGRFDVQSLGWMSAFGGDITASLASRDAAADDLRVTAEQDAVGRGGQISSPRSFHIAGGVQEVSAAQIVLHLSAGGDLGLVAAGDDAAPGSLDTRIVARRVGAIRSVGDTRLLVETTATAEQLAGAPAVGLINVSQGSYLADVQTQPGTVPGPTIITPEPVDENGLATLTGTLPDPGTLAAFTLAIDWGDPTSPDDSQAFPLGATVLTRADDGIDWDPQTRTFSVQHRYLDDNPMGTPQDDYAITLTTIDEDGIQSPLIADDLGGISVTVHNVPAEISSLEVDRKSTKTASRP